MHVLKMRCKQSGKIKINYMLSLLFGLLFFGLLPPLESTESDICHEAVYYKPYVKLMKQMNGNPMEELRETGFMDLAEHTNVILCINGPALLYRNATLLKNADPANYELPPISHYTQPKLVVYEHHCIAINKVLKEDIMMARAGTAKKDINLDQQFYGVYLIGDKDDYRSPQLVVFNDSSLSYIVNDTSANSTHSFALSGTPRQGFCTNFTFTDEEGIFHTHCIKCQTGGEDPSVCLKSGGGGGPFDQVIKWMPSDCAWTNCDADRKKNTSEVIVLVQKDNSSGFQPFATFSKGSKVIKIGDAPPPSTTEASFDPDCEGTNGTCKEDGVRHRKHCELTETEAKPSRWYCNYRHTWVVEPMEQCQPFPKLEDSVKCDPSSTVGKLTNNKCYFWQHTADTWIELDPYGDLFWRYNILDDMRKIIQKACPQVPIEWIILCNQIFIGYLKHVYRVATRSATGSVDALKHQYPEWETELQPALGFCREHAVPMDFVYEPRDPHNPKEMFKPEENPRIFVHGVPFDKQQNITELRDVDDTEDAEHIEMRKPPHPSDSFWDIYPMNVKLNNESLFFYREGIELDKRFNFAIDTVWKSFSIAAGYCNMFYQSKKPELFPRLYNAFYDDFLHYAEEYWKSDADEDGLSYVIEEFMIDDDVRLWLDVCLEGAYIFSDSKTYRPPRPLVFNEQNKQIANYFLELPEDVDSNLKTTPRLNLYKKMYPREYKCQYSGTCEPVVPDGRGARRSGYPKKRVKIRGRTMTNEIAATKKPASGDTVIKVHTKIKGTIMG